MKKKKIFIIVLAIILAITFIIIYVIKSNNNLSTSELFIKYRSDILPFPNGSSDIDIYADGTIWAKSVEYGKVKKQISQEDLDILKEKLIEIDYMNLEKEYNVYGSGSYEEIIINIDGNTKTIRLNYIMSRYDSTNLPKGLNEFMRLFKQKIYEEWFAKKIFTFFILNVIIK